MAKAVVKPFLYFLLLIIIYFIVVILLATLIKDYKSYQSITRFTGVGALLVIFLLLILKQKYNFLENIKKVNLNQILGIGLLVGGYVYLYPFLNYDTTCFDFYKGLLFYNSKLNLGSALSILIIGPILEELFYRGYLLNELIKKCNTNFSVIISAFCFSFFHFDYTIFIPTFLIGIQLGLLFLYYRNLILNIFFHMFFNIMIMYSKPVTLDDNLLFILMFISAIIYIFSYNIFNSKKMN